MKVYILRTDSILYDLSVLPPQERKSVLKYKKKLDRKLTFGSRVLQRHMIHDFLGRSEEIWRNKWGKPCCNGCSFNTSHDGTLVVGTIHNHSVGIDIVDTSRFIDYTCFQPYFKNQEWKNIRCMKDFFKFWCAKEAYVKMIGTGLRELSSIEVDMDKESIETNGKTFILNFFHIDRYVGCVCSLYGKKNDNIDLLNF